MTPFLAAVVDLDVGGPVISRHLYGHFAEHLGQCIYGGFWVGEDTDQRDIDHVRGIRTDVVEALRAIKIPNLRWPGGCFADEYHWQDGIGPRAQRPAMINTHWGGVEENNHFGTHEFTALCQLLGAEPYICANVGSGSPRETSEWVEYLTHPGSSPMARLRAENGHPEPWRVRFFGIGNEPWGCGGNLRAEQFAPLALRHATYARDHGDNTLYRVVAGAADDDYSWTETLMKQLTSGLGDRSPRERFQAVSFHYYTMSGTWSDKGSATEFSRAEYWTTIRRAHRVRELIDGHAAVMDAYDPAKKIGLALDEWGTWWNVEAGTNPGFLYQQNTMRDALVAAVHLAAFHDRADRLRLANIAQTVNVLQAMVLTEGNRIVLTPTYHVFEMSKDHHDATALAVNPVGGDSTREIDGVRVPAMSVTASKKDGRVTASVANLDPDAPARAELSLRGAKLGAISGRILAAPDVAHHNTPAAPTAVEPQDYDGARLDGEVLSLELPPASFVTLTLEMT